ncbi:MAG: metabolite traffic protein EboE, partial [Planctomycetota bacterium]
MAISTNPLSYCTNVHPGLTVDEVLQGLRDFTVSVHDQVGELAAGLWLAQPVVDELLATSGRLDDLAAFLHDSDLPCYTLNAFPYGNFHDDRVKENVYLPDWTRDSRLQYTLNCARVLSRLLPPDIEWGSMSTVPLGFKEFTQPIDFQDQCAQRLI